MILPIIDYGDVLYPIIPQCQNQRLEHIQRQAALICTKAYQRTPTVLLLNELGWESLKVRRKYHTLIIMYKVLHGNAPEYLLSLCPPSRSSSVTYNLRNNNDILPFYCKYSVFRNSFYPATVKLWNELGDNLKNSQTVTSFKKELKNIMLTNRNVYFSMFDGRAAVNLTRIRLGLSGLNGHRSLYRFIDYSYCPKCNYVIENSEHFLLFCPSYAAYRETLFNCLDNLYSDATIPFHRNLSTRINTQQCVQVLINGDPSFNKQRNVALFKSVLEYIKDTKRFI